MYIREGGCLDVVVLAHVTADVCLDEQKKHRDLFAFRINPHIDLLSFNSAFKNAAFLKHFIQNVVVLEASWQWAPGRYACSHGGNKQTRAFFFPSKQRECQAYFSAFLQLSPVAVARRLFVFCQFLLEFRAWGRWPQPHGSLLKWESFKPARIQ